MRGSTSRQLERLQACQRRNAEEKIPGNTDVGRGCWLMNVDDETTTTQMILDLTKYTLLTLRYNSLML
jgi:hypothetical protein